MRVLIIGYGNPLRCDDAVGWKITEALEASFVHPDVEIHLAHQLLPEMAEWLSQTEQIIFIDASAEGTAGTWSCFPIAASPVQEQLPSLIHKLSPTHLLGLTEALFGKTAHAEMITVVGENFGYGESLSASVAAVIPEICSYLLECLTLRLNPSMT